MKIIEINDNALKQLDDVYEFRALTQLAYNVFSDAIKSGLKVTAVIPHTKNATDQHQIESNFGLYQSGYLVELSFQHSIAVFEAWFFDILRFLLNTPQRLNKKRKIDVGDVVLASSIEDLRRMVVEAELNEIRYKKPTEWFAYLNAFVNIDLPFEADWGRVAEIKASRDILVHNQGIANRIYVEKAGALARAREGERLSIDSNYLNESWSHLKGLIQKLGNAVAKKLQT